MSKQKERIMTPDRPKEADVRPILFPNEPSTIGRERIDQAVERVLSRKK